MYRIPRDRRPVGNSSERKYGPNKFNLGPGQYELAAIFEKLGKGGPKIPKDKDRRAVDYVEPHLRQ